MPVNAPSRPPSQQTQQPGQVPPAQGGQTAIAQQIQANRTRQQQQMLQQANQRFGAAEGRLGLNAGTYSVAGQQAPASASQMQSASALNDVATRMARAYGLPIGREPLVDQYGNITYQPQTEEDMVKLQMVSDAIYNVQTQKAQQRGVAALQAGLGQVRERGRGSLAAMQSGLYEGLANLYSNQRFQQADYTLMIQQSQLRRAEELQRRYERIAKKQRRYAAIGAIVGGIAGFAVGGPAGAVVGYQLGTGAGTSASAF